MPKPPLLLFLLFAGFCMAGCNGSVPGGITGRWNFIAVDMPNVAGFLDSLISAGEDEEATMKDFFSGDKLVLRGNNTCDLAVFKKYIHGNWRYNDTTNTLIVTDAANTPLLAFGLHMGEDGRLQLSAHKETVKTLVPVFQYGVTGYSYLLNNGRFTFFLEGDDNNYFISSHDPYALANNLWRVRPQKPETEQEIYERVKRHLAFCRLVLKDAFDNGGSVSFNWFITPLVLSSNGASLRSYAESGDEWESIFYNSAQAKQGFALLTKCIENTYFEPDKARTKFENFIALLDLLSANLNKVQSGTTP